MQTALRDVLLFVLLTWLAYLVVFAIIAVVAPFVSGAVARQLLIVGAGIGILAPIVGVWNLFVLRRYYRSKALKLPKPTASESHPQSA